MTTPPPEQLVIESGGPDESLTDRARHHLRVLQREIHAHDLPLDVLAELVPLDLIERHDTLPLWVLTNRGRGFPT